MHTLRLFLFTTLFALFAHTTSAEEANTPQSFEPSQELIAFCDRIFETHDTFKHTSDKARYIPAIQQCLNLLAGVQDNARNFSLFHYCQAISEEAQRGNSSVQSALSTPLTMCAYQMGTQLLEELELSSPRK